MTQLVSGVWQMRPSTWHVWWPPLVVSGDEKSPLVMTARTNMSGIDCHGAARWCDIAKSAFKVCWRHQLQFLNLPSRADFSPLYVYWQRNSYLTTLEITRWRRYSHRLSALMIHRRDRQRRWWRWQVSATLFAACLRAICRCFFTQLTHEYLWLGGGARAGESVYAVLLQPGIQTTYRSAWLLEGMLTRRRSSPNCHVSLTCGAGRSRGMISLFEKSDWKMIEV